MVDVLVPILDRIYDFELDEERPVGELLGEMLSVIEEREGMQFSQKEALQLYFFRGEGILRKNANMEGQGVKSGDRLILI